MKSTKRTKCYQKFGLVIRIILFILNAIPWTVGMMWILGSMLLIGYYSKTDKLTWAFDFYDLTLTTPCTILFYYGVLLGITSISGCFAGSGGRWWCTGLYCLLLIGLAIFDYFWGIQVFYKYSSLMDFLDSISASMFLYLDKHATFGIYPRNVKEYWDHIQQQSNCCGLSNYTDWVYTPIGRERRLPISCCNEVYGYPDCGIHLGQHPANTKGCLNSYPEKYIGAFKNPFIIGIILAIILLLDFILSLILFIIVISCFYAPGKPITHPTQIKAQRHSHSRGQRRQGALPFEGRDPDPNDTSGHGRSRLGSEPGGQGGEQGRHRLSNRHYSPYSRRVSRSLDPVTHDQFERQRVSMPSGEFKIEIQQEQQRNLKVLKGRKRQKAFLPSVAVKGPNPNDTAGQSPHGSYLPLSEVIFGRKKPSSPPGLQEAIRLALQQPSQPPPFQEVEGQDRVILFH